MWLTFWINVLSNAPVVDIGGASNSSHVFSQIESFAIFIKKVMSCKVYLCNWICFILIRPRSGRYGPLLDNFNQLPK